MRDTLATFPFPLRLVHTAHGPRLGWFQDGRLTSLQLDAAGLQKHKMTLSDEQIEALGEANYAIGDAAASAHSAAKRAIAKSLGEDGSLTLNDSPLTMDLLRQSIIEAVVASTQLMDVTNARPPKAASPTLE